MTDMNLKSAPLVSIIVPVYNASAFLRKTIPCIMEQTYPALQIILVNDGSKDDSLLICKELAEKDNRILVLTKENGGASTARNLGIENAEGSLIGFIDCDDYIYPDMYENLVRGYLAMVSEGKKNTLIQIGREEIDEEGNRLPDAVTPPEEPVFRSPEEVASSLLMYTGDSSFCTKLVPAALLKKHNFDPGTLGEDFGLHMKMIDDMDGVYILSETGYRVVHRAGSATRRKSPDQFSGAYIDIIRQGDLVEKNVVPAHPVLAQPAFRFGLYQRLDYLLHVPVRDMHSGNAFYSEVMRYLRSNFGRMLRCEGLTSKNKAYLVLLTAAPALVRKVHWALRGKKIMSESK